MKIAKYLTSLFLAPILTFSQSAMAQNNKPDLNRRLAMYSQPAVVRLLSSCQGVFHYYGDKVPKDEEGKKIEITNVNPDDNPPIETYPFHLNFIGTGFLINSSGYIVTSSRVAKSKNDCEKGIKRNLKTKLEEEKILKDGDGIKEFNDVVENKGYLETFFGGDRNKARERGYEGQWNVYLPYSESRPLFNGNRKQFEIIKSGREDGEPLKLNRDIAIVKISFGVNDAPPALKLGNSNKVNIQDKVVIVGYPNAADFDLGEHVKLTEKSYLTPSVQEGRISNPNKELEGDYPVLQVDINAARGNAGSPILNEDGEVIGMLAYNDSDKDSDDNDNGELIPIAVSASTIKDFIQQAGTINKQGDTDTFYRQGLEDYWNGNFKAAKANFVHVRNLFPIHSEVERLIGKIDEIETARAARPWTNPFYQILFSLILGSFLIAAIVYFSAWEKLFIKEKSTKAKQIPTKNGTLFPPTTIFIELEFKGKTVYKTLVNSEHRLGRNPNWADLKVPESWEVVSNEHAILKKDGEDYCIYDGNGTKLSTNGLWSSDDSRVDPKKGYILGNGDKLTIGQIKDEQVTLSYFNPNSQKGKHKTTKMADLDRDQDKEK